MALRLAMKFKDGRHEHLEDLPDHSSNASEVDGESTDNSTQSEDEKASDPKCAYKVLLDEMT